MAALTVEDIANQALALLVEAPIDSIDEDNKIARLLRVHWETAREAELTLHAWAFAAKFPDEIEAVDTGQEGAFQYLYETPSDYLRPVWMTRDGMSDGVALTWSTWADGIRSDFAGPLKMPYIANIIDPNEWTALFTRVFVAALAIPCAHALTGKMSMIEVAQKAYEKAVEDAAGVNAFLKQGRPYTASWAVQRGDTRNWRA